MSYEDKWKGYYPIPNNMNRIRLKDKALEFRIGNPEFIKYPISEKAQSDLIKLIDQFDEKYLHYADISESMMDRSYIIKWINPSYGEGKKDDPHHAPKYIIEVHIFDSFEGTVAVLYKNNRFTSWVMESKTDIGKDPKPYIRKIEDIYVKMYGEQS